MVGKNAGGSPDNIGTPPGQKVQSRISCSIKPFPRNCVVHPGLSIRVVVCDNPYPDNIDFGLIEYVAKKFSKPGERVMVKIDESKPQRDKGAESTTYIVEW